MRIFYTQRYTTRRTLVPIIQQYYLVRQDVGEVRYDRDCGTIYKTVFGAVTTPKPHRRQRQHDKRVFLGTPEKYLAIYGK